jgi:hypothetical protein
MASAVAEIIAHCSRTHIDLHPASASRGAWYVHCFDEDSHMQDSLNSHRLFAHRGRFALVEPEDEAPSAGRGFTLSSWPGGVHRVKLWGELAPGWAGTFSLGLAAAGIDILRGYAQRTAERSWTAHVQLRAARPDVDPKSIDYARLAAAPVSAVSPSDVVLDSYYVDGSPDSGGTLFLEVRAPDRIGFLGSLLDRLAGLSLFPDEMAIDTRGGRVFDRFHLKTSEGRLPSDAARRALAGALDGLVSRPAR